jgi:hypothetical protein
MNGWKGAGFFPDTTPVRCGDEGEFVMMSEIDFMAGPVDEEKVDDVRHDQSQEEPGESWRDEEQEPEYNNADAEVMHPPSDDASHEPEVDLCVPPQSDDEEDRPEVDMCVPPPSDDEEDRPEVDVCIPPPSDDDEDDRPEVEMCLPPPSDDEEDGQADMGEEPPAYFPPPEDGNVADTPYPVDDAVPYPVDAEYPVDVAYPVDVEYPVDDAYAYPDTDDAYGANEMLAVAPYPGADMLISDEQESNEKQAPDVEVKKKKFDGDKVVVGFVPSTVKRKVATKSKAAPK